MEDIMMKDELRNFSKYFLSLVIIMTRLFSVLINFVIKRLEIKKLA